MVAAQLSEAKNLRSTDGSQKSEVGVQKSDNVNEKPEAVSQSTEDLGEDAEVATKSEVPAAIDNAAPPAPDDEGYVWPEGTDAASGAVAQNAAPEVAEAPLPTLDELVKRIPPAARETLDDLFRVRFVAVKRTDLSSFKN